MATEPSPYTDSIPATVTCPFCGAVDSKPLALFGSLLMTAHYHCNGCNSTFDWIRREPVEPPSEER